jgi:hypothetical protein
MTNDYVLIANSTLLRRYDITSGEENLSRIMLTQKQAEKKLLEVTT